MSRKTLEYVLIGLALVLALVGSYFGVRLPAPEIPEPQATLSGLSRSAGYNVPCYAVAGGTGYTCDSGGAFTVLSGAALSVEAGATASVASALSISGGQANSSWLRVAAPTAIATATPAVVIDSAGVSNILEVRDAATPVAYIANGGNVTLAQGLTVSGAVALNGGLTMDTNKFMVADTSGNTLIGGTLAVAGATTITGTLDVQGASLQYGPNDLYPLGAADSGFRVNWGSATITGTLAVTHGLTTPTVALCTLGTDPTTGEEAHCSTTIAGSTVTVKVWKTDHTTAGDSGVTVYWTVIGLP